MAARRSELETEMGPAHMMALSAEGLKCCTGGSEQVPGLCTRFHRQVNLRHEQSVTFRMLAKELRERDLLPKGTTLLQLAEMLDGVINKRNKYIHLEAPPDLDTRMEATRQLILRNPALERQHPHCALVIKNWQILKRLYKL